MLYNCSLPLLACGWILIRKNNRIVHSNNRTMSCLKGRLLVLVHQKQENFRTVCWKLINFECRLKKAREEKRELAAELGAKETGGKAQGRQSCCTACTVSEGDANYLLFEV